MLVTSTDNAAYAACKIIFDYLEPEVLAKFTSVCKSWQRAIIQNPIWNRLLRERHTFTPLKESETAYQKICEIHNRLLKLKKGCNWQRLPLNEIPRRNPFQDSICSQKLASLKAHSGYLFGEYKDHWRVWDCDTFEAVTRITDKHFIPTERFNISWTGKKISITPIGHTIDLESTINRVQVYGDFLFATTASRKIVVFDLSKPEFPQVQIFQARCFHCRSDYFILEHEKKFQILSLPNFQPILNIPRTEQTRYFQHSISIKGSHLVQLKSQQHINLKTLERTALPICLPLTDWLPHPHHPDRLILSDMQGLRVADLKEGVVQKFQKQNNTRFLSQIGLYLLCQRNHTRGSDFSLWEITDNQLGKQIQLACRDNDPIVDVYQYENYILGYSWRSLVIWDLNKKPKSSKLYGLVIEDFGYGNEDANIKDLKVVDGRLFVGFENGEVWVSKDKEQRNKRRKLAE